VVPFQCRIKLVAGELLVETAPTAQASRPDVTATALRETLPLGLGLGTGFQLVPFQCRIRLWPLLVLPAAHALLAEVAATALSSPLGRPELGACF